MTSVSEHYAKLLAPIYVWMAGGIDAALAQGADEVSPLGPAGSITRMAIDLGAGFGMHAVPLARMGYSVTAIDTSPVLLAELRKHAAGLDVRAIEADLRRFSEHVAARADLILCMGDTITHLEELADVERLFERVAEQLAPAGRFVLTFRDYTTSLTGNARFIPVRSDADRIHTCFLEEAPAHMVVHDLVYERQDASWTFRVSSYRKLRLSPEWLMQALDRVGLAASLTTGPRGMLRIGATAV
jgi:SAM-dependent methyltransferase